MFADYDKHLKMKVFPAIIYSVVLIMSIACFCNGAGNGSTGSLNVDAESDEGTGRCALNVDWLF